LLSKPHYHQSFQNFAFSFRSFSSQHDFGPHIVCERVVVQHKASLLADFLHRMILTQYGGNVWKFVEQADSLGVKDIDSPTKRPSVQDALEELARLQVRSGSADGE
jgi:hypothetical protein